MRMKANEKIDLTLIEPPEERHEGAKMRRKTEE